jgi:hypothetical protein
MTSSFIPQRIKRAKQLTRAPAATARHRYNPLHNELEAYALAYGIASLLNNLFGRGKEPFWQQAYTNLVKFIILLHKVLYDYVTLFDVYECAINPHKLEARIAEGEELFSTADYISIDDAIYVAHRELSRFSLGADRGNELDEGPSKLTS